MFAPLSLLQLIIGEMMWRFTTSTPRSTLWKATMSSKVNPPTRQQNVGSIAEMFHPHLTFDLCSAIRRECKYRPWAYGRKAEVRELWHGAGEERRHDHVHFLPAAGHDQRHLQSRDVRVAHVLTLHLLRVGVWPRPPQLLSCHVLPGNRLVWLVCSNVCCSAAGWCCAAAWSPSSWTTSRMRTTPAPAATGCSTSRRNNAANDQRWWRPADPSHWNRR